MDFTGLKNTDVEDIDTVYKRLNRKMGWELFLTKVCEMYEAKGGKRSYRECAHFVAVDYSQEQQELEQGKTCPFNNKPGRTLCDKAGCQLWDKPGNKCGFSSLTEALQVIANAYRPLEG
jgi:hypothetical protein